MTVFVVTTQSVYIKVTLLVFKEQQGWRPLAARVIRFNLKIRSPGKAILAVWSTLIALVGTGEIVLSFVKPNYTGAKIFALTTHNACKMP